MKSAADEFLLDVESKTVSLDASGVLRDRCAPAEVRSVLLGEASSSQATESQTQMSQAQMSRVWEKGPETLRLLAELGALSAVVPESCGGLGLGFIAADVIVRECARVLLPLPLSETLGAVVSVFSARETEGSRGLLEAVASRAMMLALPAEGGAIEKLKVSKRSQLTAELRLVAYADQVAALLVGDPESGRFYVVRRQPSDSKQAETKQAESQQLSLQPTFDLVRPYFAVTLNNAEAELVGTLSDSAAASLRLALLSCSEMIGATERALEMTLEHVQTRKQYGKPIGSFQAVQHALADIALELEQASALTRFAAWCANSDAEQFQSAALAAVGFCAEALPRAVESALQAHGGIGFTFEYDLHLYLRRVKTLALVHGKQGGRFLQLGKQFLRSPGTS